MSHETVTARVTGGLDGLGGLAAEWRQLFDRVDAQPSLSYEWTCALARTQVLDDDACFVIDLRRNGLLVGVVPLYGRCPKVLGVKHRVLRPLAELKNTHSDLLIERGDAEALKAFLSALRDLEYPWDSIRLSKLVDGHDLTGALEREASALRYVPRRRYRKPAFWLALPACYEDYLASRSQKFRNHARRAEKKLRAAGRLREMEYTAPEDFEAGYDALIQIERGSWKELRGTSIAASARQSALYREWGRTAPPGHVHLQVLWLDNEPIAHNLGCIHLGTYFYLKTSYTASLRPLSPATFLRLSLIRRLIERGLRAVDFCGPPYAWEQQWTAEYRWHHVLSIYAPTVRGRLLSLADRWTHYSTAVPILTHEDPRRQSTAE